MKRFGLTFLAAGLFLAAVSSPSPADPSDPEPSGRTGDAPRGTRMRIRQEYLLGADSATGDYRACFLPPDQFRVEGIKRLNSMASDVHITVAGNGRLVRQIETVGEKTTAHVVDLDRVRKELPWADYSPAKTYDPSVYRDMLKDAKEKKALPAEELDGVPTEGFELALSSGRLSLPFNVPIVLPDPAKIRFWINPKDGIARKIELEDAQGRVFLRTRYTAVETGVQVNPDVFELELPKDVTPGDLTNVVIRGVETTRQHPAGQPAEPKPAGK